MAKIEIDLEIETKGREVFSIDVSNPLGKTFLALLPLFLNKSKYKIRKRGRHSNRGEVMRKANHKPNYTGDIPIGLAKRIAVYIESK